MEESEPAIPGVWAPVGIGEGSAFAISSFIGGAAVSDGGCVRSMSSLMDVWTLMDRLRWLYSTGTFRRRHFP